MPTWSLGGSVIDLPAGATVSVQQSPWKPNHDGWASSIVLHGDAGGPGRRTAQLRVTHSLPAVVAPVLARTLIAFRLRALGPDGPEHLGDIYVR